MCRVVLVMVMVMVMVMVVVVVVVVEMEVEAEVEVYGRRETHEAEEESFRVGLAFVASRRALLVVVFGEGCSGPKADRELVLTSLAVHYGVVTFA
ncbi:hypothetical protein M0804_007888 [Polistes exclamans]|nr:hypothetical protein M0804_007888 [Polistes exclamans]